MFLRGNTRIKDGKEHRYYTVVESARLQSGKVAQRQVLYLGEINDSQPGYGFSNSSPHVCHALQPPSSEIGFVCPIFCSLSAPRADRNPPPQYNTSVVPLSGYFAS